MKDKNIQYNVYDGGQDDWHIVASHENEEDAIAFVNKYFGPGNEYRIQRECFNPSSYIENGMAYYEFLLHLENLDQEINEKNFESIHLNKRYPHSEEVYIHYYWDFAFLVQMEAESYQDLVHKINTKDFKEELKKKMEQEDENQEKE